MTQHVIRVASFLHLGIGASMSCLGFGHVVLGVVLMAGFLQNPQVAGGGAAILVLAWAFGAWLATLAVGVIGILDVASGLALRRDDPDWRLSGAFLAAFLVVPNVLAVPAACATLFVDWIVLSLA
jgi:hypothetical protein